MTYDLIIIGNSEDRGSQAALQAAADNKRVALILPPNRLTGPNAQPAPCSALLRRALSDILNQREETTESLTPNPYEHEINLAQTLDRLSEQKHQSLQDRLECNGVDLFYAKPRFLSACTMEIEQNGWNATIETKNLLIATGSVPRRPDRIPFDGQQICDSDEILNINRVPRSLIVVGAGKTGIERALFFACLGARVTLIDGRKRLGEDCDSDLTDALITEMRSLGIELRLGQEVIGVDDSSPQRATLRLQNPNGEQISAEKVAFCVGRMGRTQNLNLAAAGLMADERDRLWCDSHQQTWTPGIYAVGDVVGFPHHIADSDGQTRRALAHAFQRSADQREIPAYELLALPKMVSVGQTEEQLQNQQRPYEIHLIRWAEGEENSLIDPDRGCLKVLSQPRDGQLLGIHYLGNFSVELQNLAQDIIASQGTLGFFWEALDTTFHNRMQDWESGFGRLSALKAENAEALNEQNNPQIPHVPLPTGTALWASEAETFETTGV